MLLAIAFLASCLAPAGPAASGAPRQWWERGQDAWHYKDDWTALFLSGARAYAKTFQIPGGIRAAWLQVWADRYTLYANGREVGRDQDAGTIENYDLAPFLHPGRNEIRIEGGRQVIAEGGVIPADGRRIPIRTDASWGERIRTSRERTSGPRGYAGDAHQALPAAHTPEERLKLRINRIFSLRNRLRDRDRLLFFTLRRPDEVLTLDTATPEERAWRRIEDAVREAVAGPERARSLLRAGRIEEAEAALEGPERRARGAQETLAALMAILEVDALARATALQAELLAGAGLIPGAGADAMRLALRGLRPEIAGLREMAATGDPTRAIGRARALRGRIEAARLGLERAVGSPLDPLDRSSRNRLGWVASPEILDNDPAWWEFSTAPLDAGLIDLAGRWRFRLDPADAGLREGWARPGAGPGGDGDESPGGSHGPWSWIFAPLEWGWERAGHRRENLRVQGRNNKPYNGLAWYRKAIRVPDGWEGDLILRLGPRGGNRDRLWVDGVPVGPEEGTSAGSFRIPGDRMRPGVHVLALRTLNPSNIGGLIGRGLALFRADRVPGIFRAPCGMGVLREARYRTDRNEVLERTLSPALVPAAIIATDDDRLTLWGWRAKGWREPEYVTWPAAEGFRTTPFTGTGGTGTRSLPDPVPGWILLGSRAKREGVPRPLLLVFGARPKRIEIAGDGAGGRALVAVLPARGIRAALMRLPPARGGSAQPGGPAAPSGPLPARSPAGPPPDLLERARFWAGILRRPPVEMAEICRFEGGIARVRQAFAYLDLAGGGGGSPPLLAPVPMLLSLALASGWPGAEVEGGARELLPTSPPAWLPDSPSWGAYRARVGGGGIAYRYDRLEPKIHYKGVGTWLEARTMGEREFGLLRDWGANATRPQVPFHAEWHARGFFEHPDGHWTGRSRIRWEGPGLAWLRGHLELHRRFGLCCFLNWFSNDDRPVEAYGGAPINSTRAWRRDPRTRRILIDFWRRMAETCRDLPEELVCYDLFNEPAYFYPDDYNRLVEEVVRAIRAVDPIHWIAVESGNGWAQPEDFDHLRPVDDRKVFYEFHGYGPHAGDVYRRDIWYPRYEPERERIRCYQAWEERLLPVLHFMIRHQVPLFHGEFGISFLGPDDAPRRWLEDLLSIHEKYRIHWTWWNLDGGEIHRTGLLAGERVNPLVETLSRFMRMRPAAR